MNYDLKNLQKHNERNARYCVFLNDMYNTQVYTNNLDDSVILKQTEIPKEQWTIIDLIDILPKIEENEEQEN